MPNTSNDHLFIFIEFNRDKVEVGEAIRRSSKVSDQAFDVQLKDHSVESKHCWLTEDKQDYAVWRSSKHVGTKRASYTAKALFANCSQVHPRIHTKLNLGGVQF